MAMAWKKIEVGEKIGDAAGLTKTVQFRNPSTSKGQYSLKIGLASQQNHDLAGGEKSDKYAVGKQSWNATNNGKVELEYQRDNSPTEDDSDTTSA